MIAFLHAELRRLVPEHYDNLVFDINSSIVVVLEFVGRGAIPGKTIAPCADPDEEKLNGTKSCFAFNSRFLPAGHDREFILPLHLRACDQRKRL